MMNIKKITPQQLREKLARGALLIDIRHVDEHRREYIEHSLNRPLDDLQQKIETDATCVVFHCQSGLRTQANIERLAKTAEHVAEVYILDGGLAAWKKAGFATVADKGQPLPLMRQVQIAAGGLVLLGVLLGYGVSPWGFLLSGLVGAGLVFAGISGFCGMAVLLSKCPWNKR
ncbi:rhodanese family protein [Exercitatus varius]|uniref:rhodanese family protein n=2 Tax=Exercitatus varius TaxID=67857 RepID=UPI00374F7234